MAIKELGLEAAPAEVDSLFATLDIDGSGSLELSELKPARRMMMQAAEEAAARMDSFELSVALLRKQVATTTAELAVVRTEANAWRRARERETAEAAAQEARLAE